MGCVFVFMWHVDTTVIIRFCCFPLPANEAGETPLDIARRLKHLQCEELVSLLCLDSAYVCKHITS